MSDPETLDPQKIYKTRIQKRAAELERLRKRDSFIAWSRLAVFLLLVASVVLAYLFKGFPYALSALPALGFVILMTLHSRVIQKKEETERRVMFYQHGLRRLQHEWHGKGNQGLAYLDPDHPFAEDLDLFGKGSLFELICSVRTPMGEATLARWFNCCAELEEVKKRQEAVAELRSELGFREEVFAQAGADQAALTPQDLIDWGKKSPAFSSSWGNAARIAAILLAAASVTLLVLWLKTGLSPIPFFSVLLLQWITLRLTRGRMSPAVRGVESSERQLQLLGRLIRILEQTSFSSARFQEIRRQLGFGPVQEGSSGTASGAIARLDRLVAWQQSQHNVIFALISFLLMVPIHLAVAVANWRKQYGRHVGRWLDAVGQAEALVSLSGYSYESPGDPFPEVVAEGPLLEGEDLGHPLIPDEICVRNTVLLGNPTRALIISGSNMSGKTTLLRTTGVNAVLAMAGSTVRAKKLRICPLSIGATIRIEDSLQAGSSRFYAEIRRLKQLMDLTRKPRPVLFLLDELLHGTNSNDRRTGTATLLAQFLEKGAIGLVTTHDLGVSEAAQRFEGKVANVHFADEIVDGKLVFDYKIKEGVVTRSNALALMRAVGLEV